MYIYQADCWCNSCGKAICDRIAAEGFAPEDPDDERTFDSDEYPKYCGEDEESDGPQHCAAMDECLEAEVLSDGSRVGALLSTSLTTYGVDHLKEMVAEGGNPALHEFWKSQFDWVDFRRPFLFSVPTTMCFTVDADSQEEAEKLAAEYAEGYFDGVEIDEDQAAVVYCEDPPTLENA